MAVNLINKLLFHHKIKVIITTECDYLERQFKSKAPSRLGLKCFEAKRKRETLKGYDVNILLNESS